MPRDLNVASLAANEIAPLYVIAVDRTMSPAKVVVHVAVGPS